MLKLSIFLIPGIIFSSTLNINDFKGTFKQTITTQKNKKITYTGKIKFLNGTMKWEYKTPTKKEICSKDKQMLLVNHDLEQVTLFTTHKKINFLNIINKAKHHHKNIYTFKMFDKTYTLSIKNKEIQYITFYDNMENKVLIQFKNISHKNIKNMSCNYPNNYDFIKD